MPGQPFDHRPPRLALGRAQRPFGLLGGVQQRTARLTPGQSGLQGDPHRPADDVERALRGLAQFAGEL